MNFIVFMTKLVLLLLIKVILILLLLRNAELSAVIISVVEIYFDMNPYILIFQLDFSFSVSKM